MKLRAALLLGCLLMASPAFGAGSLDALRAGSRSVRDQVSQLRAEQLKKRSELSVLSSRIEELKGKSKGRLLPGGELDTALKASQELSGALTDLAQQVSARETDLEAANLALLDGLSGELNRLRADFDREADRSKRKGLIDQMRRLRAEREALRATLPAAKLPTLDAVRPSDDPEELLEQADLLRDNEEKLQKELKALDTRIAERRQEADLDRRVQRFLGEESMFDDQDRRLRVQRTTAAGANGTPVAPGGGESQDPSAFSSVNSQDTAGSPPSGPLSPQAATGREPPPPPLGGLDKSNVSITSGSDARPQVGSANPNTVAGGDDDLEDLEVQRLKLKGLADELKKKAQELEKRAGQLR
ncbi:MAG: TetR family transcriptional regulator [Myxococcales bacterium]|nr:TetR family transcriptional regulator [Myxococcales bacterium]